MAFLMAAAAMLIRRKKVESNGGRLDQVRYMQQPTVTTQYEVVKSKKIQASVAAEC